MSVEKTYREVVMQFFGQVAHHLYNELQTASTPLKTLYGHEFEWAGLEVDLRYSPESYGCHIRVKVSTVEEDDVSPKCREDGLRIDDDYTPKGMAMKVKDKLKELERLI